MSIRMAGIPILMYHRIGVVAVPADAPDRKYWVSPETFRQQLSHIQSLKLRVGLLSEYWGAAPASSHAGDSVVITFDDGRASDYEAAFPLLGQSGVRAEFFLSTANVGQAGYITWDQVAEMQRAGMSFQSHAHDHIVLLGLSPARLEYQLRASKYRLEDRLGCAVQFLAAPYGLVSRAVIEAAWQAGYHGLCNSRHWPAQPGARLINRVAIHAHTSIEQFAGLLTRRPRAYLLGFARMALSQLPKRILLKVRPGLLTEAPVPEQA